MTKKGSPAGQKKGRETYEHHIKIDGEQAHNHDAVLLPKNHLKQGKLYNDFCILNQEFLKYILSLKLSVSEYKILMFLLSYMDKENKIIIDSEMIEYHLGINKTHVNKYIKKLVGHRIIYKRNLGYKNGQEVLINFDVISPHMVYKNKNNHDNVQHHKLLMQKDVPYIRQRNIEGGIDLVNGDTGEVFHEIKNK